MARGIVTLGLAALAAGLTTIFSWVQRQQDLDARMREFVGLLLIAGILYAIGVFWVGRFRPGATALFIILAGAVLFRVVLLPSTSGWPTTAEPRRTKLGFGGIKEKLEVSACRRPDLFLTR